MYIHPNALFFFQNTPGLPNIIGSGMSRVLQNGSGACYTSSGGGGLQYGLIALNSIAFNASMYNEIYGNSETVQPPAIRVYVWIRES